MVGDNGSACYSPRCCQRFYQRCYLWRHWRLFGLCTADFCSYPCGRHSRGQWLSRSGCGYLPQTSASFWPYWKKLYPYALWCRLCHSRYLRSANSRLYAQALANLFGHPINALLCASAGVYPDYCGVYTGAKGIGWPNWLAGLSHVWHLCVRHSLRSSGNCHSVSRQ